MAAKPLALSVLRETLDAYERHEHSRVKAAAALGISVPTFESRLKAARVAEQGERLAPVVQVASTAHDVARVLIARLKRSGATLPQLASDCQLTQGQVLDGLLGLQAGGANVHPFGEVWSLERAPHVGNAVVDPTYRSRPNGRYRFGWMGDTHLCSKYERRDVLDDLYRRFADADIDRVFHAGNWIDGEARFNKFDLLVHGMDAQIRYLRDHYPTVPGLTTYAIAGDDHEGWYSQREGVDIGKYCENEMRAGGRTDWVNLGYMEAYIPLQHAVTGKTAQLHLVHPGGGSAYATSYTVQKLVESYSGGNKPAVLLAGHYHKLEYLCTRNVHCIQTGCTQDQTPFARKKRLHYALGGGVCELEQDAETGAIVGCTVTVWNYFDAGYYATNRFSLSGHVALGSLTRGGAGAPL
jgi:hypothetical protein